MYTQGFSKLKDQTAIQGYKPLNSNYRAEPEAYDYDEIRPKG